MHVGKIAYKMQLDLKNAELGTNLGPTWGQFVSKMEPRRAKMEPRRGKLEPSWANLGQLEPTWSQVGGQAGAKLATKSEKMGYQDDVKKIVKIWSRSGPQVVRGGAGTWPLRVL